MSSDAKKRADAKYRAKKLSDGTKKQINATIDTADYNIIEQYSAAQSLSKAQTIVRAIKYCAAHNIDLK